MDQKLYETAIKKTHKDKLIQALKQHNELTTRDIFALIGPTGYTKSLLANLTVNGTITKRRCECGNTAYYSLNKIFK